MSHPENTKLMEEFLEECERTVACPYCGTPTEDPCCGENHNEECLDHPELGVILDSEVQEQFEYWLSLKERQK